MSALNVLVLFVLLVAKVTAQNFTATGSMNLGRSNHAATLLNSGKVLVTGGDFPPGAATNTAEIYDPTTGVWRYTLFPMNIARDQHSATLLPNGKVLIAGGDNPGVGPFTSAELFDPFSETFTLTSSMSNVRQSHQAVLLADGRVLVVSGRTNVGGFVTPTNEIYDPALGSWSPAPSLTAGVTNHTATLLPSGQVLVAGGYDGFTPTAYNFVYLYTPSTNSMVSMSPLLIQRSDHGAALLPNGKVLIAAGLDFSFVLNSTEIYDPTISPSGLSAFGTNLLQPRRHFTTSTMGNGDVLVAGGFQSGNGCCFVTTLATAELRDHGTGVWASAGSMSTPRTTHTATSLLDGRVLVTGGNSGSGILSSAEIWGGKTDTTTNITGHAPDPSFVGQPYTVSFTVAAQSPGGGTPTGAVTVSDGTGATCGGALSGGSGSCSLTSSTAGAKTLTVTYLEDGRFNGSSNTAAHQVNKASTATTLRSSQNPSGSGQSVTFSTVTTAAPSGGTPTGTVDFRDGTTVLSTVTLNTSGQAMFTTSSLGVGAHSITASYNGDSNFNSSVTPRFSQTVVPPPTAGGSFVIGDLNAVVGEGVTFWGAQWAKLNSLSGGSAPAGFKGFANLPRANPLTCGGAWESDPGNSSGPPNSVPSYIAVVVSSSISKSGATIAGNIPQMVIVKTGPGYGPNPGHAGTGTVVAVICP